MSTAPYYKETVTSQRAKIPKDSKNKQVSVVMGLNLAVAKEELLVASLKQTVAGSRLFVAEEHDTVATKEELVARWQQLFGRKNIVTKTDEFVAKKNKLASTIQIEVAASVNDAIFHGATSTIKHVVKKNAV